MTKITPPNQWLKHQRFHWISLLDFDGRPVSTIVLQWNPVNQTWSHCGEAVEYKSTQQMVYLGVCEVPDQIIDRMVENLANAS